MVRTTINIDAEVYRKLCKVAEIKGVEIEDVILAVLRFFSRKFRSEIVGYDAVRYQERRSDSRWQRVHVRWFGEEYEFVIDLRKVHKKSVSFLIAEAFELFYNEISLIIDQYLDNYQEYNYAIAKFNIHNMIGCIVMWGYPIKHPPI